MPQNQFLPVATGDGANTLTAAQYAALGVLAQGFQSGVLPSIEFNTVLRQLSTVVAAMAQFTADNQTADVLDDGVVSNFESKFSAALKGALSSSSVHYGVATGTNDAMVVTAVPPLKPTTGGSYQEGSFLILKTPGSSNTSTAPTVNSNSIGNIAITKRDGSSLKVGDIPPNTWIALFFDGTGCFLVALAPSDILGSIPAGSLWHVGTDTSSSASAIVAAVAPAVTSRIAKIPYLIFPAHDCAGVTTIDVGFGVEPLTRRDGSALVSGDYLAGQPLVIVDDGANFRVLAGLSQETSAIHKGDDTGSANAIVVMVDPPITAYREGQRYEIKLANAITGPGATANICGLSVRTIVRADGTPTQANDGVVGQMLDLIDDGTHLQIPGLTTALSSGRLINTQIFPTAGTYPYTPTPGTKSIVVTVEGAGGAGSGCNAPPGGGYFAVGAGGGGGGAAQSSLLLSTSGVSGATIVVGLHGAGATGNGTGQSGGTSSFGSFLSATGGAGGTGGGTASNAGTTITGGGTGGTGSGGNIYNKVGGFGTMGAASGTTDLVGGGGGSSANGAAGANSTTGAGPGSSAVSPCTGGGGGTQVGGNPAQVGGNGQDGRVVIQEYS